MGVTLRPMNRPLGRQPFRPGQWQGARIGTKHTTYIQNNFFGSSYGTGFNYGSYMDYGNYCNHDTGLSKGAKWLLGLGIGTTLLGGILKLFGVGGKDETGSVQGQGNQPADQDRIVLDNQSTGPSGVDGDDGVDDDNKVDDDTTTETTTPPPADTNPTDEDDNDGPIKTNWGVQTMVCREHNGKTLNIEGELTIDPKNKGAEGEPPKEFTITDTSSGTAHVYKYVLTGEKGKDGQPIYKCVSMNDQPISANSDNRYTLETGENGTPELVQYNNQANFGTGLKFGSVAAQPLTQGQPNTPPETEAEEPASETGNKPTQAEKDAAKLAGHNVAEDLIGYTNQAETEDVITELNKLNSETIVDFLDGYKGNSGLFGIGKGIIEQINRESTDGEKADMDGNGLADNFTNEQKLKSQQKILNAVIDKAIATGVITEADVQEKFNTFRKGEGYNVDNTGAANIDSYINELLDKIKAKEADNAKAEQTKNQPTLDNITAQIKSSPKYQNADVTINKNSDGSYQVHIKFKNGNEESRKIADINKFDINEFTSRA